MALISWIMYMWKHSLSLIFILCCKINVQNLYIFYSSSLSWSGEWEGEGLQRGQVAGWRWTPANLLPEATTSIDLMGMVQPESPQSFFDCKYLLPLVPTINHRSDELWQSQGRELGLEKEKKKMGCTAETLTSARLYWPKSILMGIDSDIEWSVTKNGCSCSWFAGFSLLSQVVRKRLIHSWTDSVGVLLKFVFCVLCYLQSVIFLQKPNSLSPGTSLIIPLVSVWVMFSLPCFWKHCLNIFQ